jgi:hypothetical protein
MVAIKVKGATPQGSETLCRTFSCGHIIKGFRATEEEVFCRYFYLEREIHSPVRNARSTKTGDWRANTRWKISLGFCERIRPGAAWALSARNSFEHAKPKRPFFPQ